MSRVYEALKRAEEEAKEKPKEAPPLRVFEEKPVFPKMEPVLEHRDEDDLEMRFPAEDRPLLTAQPNSFAEEQFRKLRTQILLHSPNPPHTILVTSSVPSEGKTMVAFNLAVSLSREIQKKIILIDGDLRKPSIYLNQYRNSKGLSNFLTNQASLPEILLDSEIENLRIITAGSLTRKSPELIGSKKMWELLRSLRELGDDTYIIIDSPPIIATSEPTLLSKMVDGIVLVVMGGRTPKEAVRRSVKSIDRQKIVGIVLNQIDLMPSSYYSHYYYRYDMKYGRSRNSKAKA
jgi:protein-tyrosine kinase